MYKESTAWQTTWFVPHDVNGLMTLMGGREGFVKRLDEFFATPYQPRAIARDITGLIGQYCHGNEPDHHAPYLYAWGGAPWRTQELVRRILDSMYGSDQAGLLGALDRCAGQVDPKTPSGVFSAAWPDDRDAGSAASEWFLGLCDGTRPRPEWEQQ